MNNRFAFVFMILTNFTVIAQYLPSLRTHVRAAIHTEFVRLDAVQVKRGIFIQSIRVNYAGITFNSKYYVAQKCLDRR